MFIAHALATPHARGVRHPFHHGVEGMASKTKIKVNGRVFGGFARTFAAVVAQIEVDTKTGKISVKHLAGA
ncbi:MAG TPA: hypothetical protein VLN26_18005, partial [Gaiellaceae bacterium]|nr:hypothetical protein [Gaiellaceae bacterium]